MSQPDRGQWKSKIGFILAASGSAIGLAKAAAGGWPLQVGLFHHQDLSRVLRRLAGGFDQVLYLDGHMQGWRNAGLPLEVRDPAL